LNGISKRTLAALAVLVAVAGGFIGLLYGGGVNFGTKTVTVVQIVTSYVTTSAPTPTTNQYVAIAYSGWIYASWGSYTPKTGDVVLILGVTVENHGYDSFPTGSHSGFNWAYYFHLAVGNQQFDPLYPSDLQDKLPMTDVLNGLTVKGYIAFEIPANFGTYSLIYKAETGTYNVRYFNYGVTTISQTMTS
jgi:hypothetical protein